MNELNFSSIDAVIIDLDGTMVDTVGDFCVALNLMLRDLPPPFDAHTMESSTVSQMIGKGSENLIKSVLSHISCARAAIDLDVKPLQTHDLYALFEPAWLSYQAHYRAVNGQHATVFPGVLAGLQQLKAAGVRMACLTNKPTDFALALLKEKGLAPFFEHTFGGDAFEHKKPHPLPLLKTCEALGSQPHRTLMVGDSSNDAQAARAAGCPVALVTYGYNHGQPVQSVDADVFVDSLEYLMRL
jgi:phosphoglycolate phosphatase